MRSSLFSSQSLERSLVSSAPEVDLTRRPSSAVLATPDRSRLDDKDAEDGRDHAMVANF